MRAVGVKTHFLFKVKRKVHCSLGKSLAALLQNSNISDNHATSTLGNIYVSAELRFEGAGGEFGLPDRMDRFHMGLCLKRHTYYFFYINLHNFLKTIYFLNNYLKTM